MQHQAKIEYLLAEYGECYYVSEAIRLLEWEPSLSAEQAYQQIKQDEEIANIRFNNFLAKNV